MIAKSVPSRERTRSFKATAEYVANEAKQDGVAASWGNLAAYALDAGRGGQKVADGSVRFTNFPEGLSSLDEAMIEVAETQGRARAARGGREADDTYHLVISFPPGETPTADQLRDMEDELVKAIGLEDHQRLSAIHTDKDHLHVHVAINKVHPDTLKLASLSHDHRKLMAACKVLEVKHGLERTHADRVRMPDGTTVTGAAADLEGQTGEVSLQRWIKEHARGELMAAGSWEDLHDAAEAKGLFVKKQGAGLVIGTAERPELRVKASDVDRGLSIKRLEDRLGPFVLPRDRGDRPDRPAPEGPDRGDPEPGVRPRGGEGSRYRPEPLDPKAKGSALWERYTVTRAAAPKARDEALREIKERHAAYRGTVRDEAAEHRRAAPLRFYTPERRQQHRDEARERLRRSREDAARERKEAFERTRAPNWHDFLCDEVKAGNAEALKLLRSVERKRRALEYNIMRAADLSEGKTVILADTRKSVGKDGTVRYVTGDGGTVIDRTATVGVGTVSAASATLALALAAERFDRPIKVDGTDEFKAAVAKAAAISGSKVQFAGAEMQALHRAAVVEREAWLKRAEAGPTWLAVPFEDRETVQARGAAWDRERKLWFVPAGDDPGAAGLADWIAGPSGRVNERTYLVVPFAQKDQAKAAGARWDKDVGRWYAPEGVKLDGFGAWMKGDTSRAAMDRPREALTVPRDFRPFAEQMGAEWDKEARSWFAPAGCTAEDIDMGMFRPAAGRFSDERTYLNVPFAQKDEAKAAGARYDRERRLWYAPPGCDLDDFKRWNNLAEARTDKQAIADYLAGNKSNRIEIHKPGRSAPLEGRLLGIDELTERVSFARVEREDGTTSLVQLGREIAAGLAIGQKVAVSANGEVTDAAQTASRPTGRSRS